MKDKGTVRCWWKLGEIFELIYSKHDIIIQWYAVLALMYVGLLSDEDTC